MNQKGLTLSIRRSQKWEQRPFLRQQPYGPMDNKLQPVCLRLDSAHYLPFPSWLTSWILGFLNQYPQLHSQLHKINMYPCPLHTPTRSFFLPTNSGKNAFLIIHVINTYSLQLMHFYYIYTYKCIYVCMYICVYKHVYAHTYTHTHVYVSYNVFLQLNTDQYSHLTSLCYIQNVEVRTNDI